MTRLGRKPQGAGLVTPLAGSEHAKRRLILFLQTLSGRCSVGEACPTGDRRVAVLCPAGRMATRVAGTVGASSPGRPAERAAAPYLGGIASAGQAQAQAGGPRGGGGSPGGIDPYAAARHAGFGQEKNGRHVVGAERGLGTSVGACGEKLKDVRGLSSEPASAATAACANKGRCRWRRLAAVQEHGVPVHVTRLLTLSERTARRWRQGTQAARSRPAAAARSRASVTPCSASCGSAAPRLRWPPCGPPSRMFTARNCKRCWPAIDGCNGEGPALSEPIGMAATGTVWAADFKERSEPMKDGMGGSWR